MEKPLLGGQAVIEGVMMRGKRAWTVAVRAPDGSIASLNQQMRSASQRVPILGQPVVRGIVVLVETVGLAIRSLAYSASVSTGEEQEGLSAREIVVSFGLAFVLIIGLFMVVPFYLTRGVSAMVPNRFLFALIEGGFRISIFVAYIFAISRLKDVRRVFEYHGAEHKSIHAYEAGAELRPEVVEAYSPLHMRCGTSFLLIVMVVAIFTFSFLPTTSALVRIAGKLALIPLIAGVSYEIIKLAARHDGSWVARVIMTPGLLLQKLTTREPDREEIEVAIVALQAVLEADTAPEPQEG